MAVPSGGVRGFVRAFRFSGDSAFGDASLAVRRYSQLPMIRKADQ